MSIKMDYEEKIEKCCLENSDLPIEFVKEVLISNNSDRALAEPFKFEGDDDFQEN